MRYHNHYNFTDKDTEVTHDTKSMSNKKPTFVL